MLQNPFITPAVVVAPLIGVEVESAVVYGRDGEVLGKVNALCRSLVLSLRHAFVYLNGNIP